MACIPVFRKGLEQFEGISNVKQLPMLNRVVVEFDPLMTNETRVRDKIFDVAEKAGFKGKVIISRQG